VKSVDTRDLKSLGLFGRASSSLAPGTTSISLYPSFIDLFYHCLNDTFVSILLLTYINILLKNFINHLIKDVLVV
ncbi:hypothetical protein J3U29_09505, partial [Gilliamella sp. B3825]|uniref:hypothetical protein n=1 Tax=Gilliamella sp. B3825 TaxID=2818003 RepID=UPI002269FED8